MTAFHSRNCTLLQVIKFFLSPAEEDSVFDESDIHDTPTGPCNKESQTFFARLKRIGGSKMVKYQPVEMNAQRSMIFFIAINLCRSTISYSSFRLSPFFVELIAMYNLNTSPLSDFWEQVLFISLYEFSYRNLRSLTGISKMKVSKISSCFLKT